MGKSRVIFCCRIPSATVKVILTRKSDHLNRSTPCTLPSRPFLPPSHLIRIASAPHRPARPPSGRPWPPAAGRWGTRGRTTRSRHRGAASPEGVRSVRGSLAIVRAWVKRRESYGIEMAGCERRCVRRCVVRADGWMGVGLRGWVKGRGGFVDVCASRRVDGWFAGLVES